MFIKIFIEGKNDFIAVYECERYTAVTHNKDDNQMVFYIHSKYRDDGEEIAIDKRSRYVYVENSNGKTVGNYKWKYDEEKERCIRI